MARAGDYGALAALSWVHVRNAVVFGARKPANWAFALIFALMLAFLGELGAAGFGTAGRVSPATLPVAAWNGYFLIFLLYAAGTMAAPGAALIRDSEAGTLRVYGSPIAPRSILRYRVVRAWLLLLGLMLAFSAMIGGYLAGLVTIGWTEAAWRSWLALTPFFADVMLLSTLLSLASRRRGGEHVVDAIAGAFVILLALFVVLIPSSGTGFERLAQDPVYRAAASLTGPLLLWMAGAAPSAGTVAGISSLWGLSGLGMYVVAQAEYPMPGSFQAVTVAAGVAMGPEQPLPDSAFTRWRKRLRPRYRDYGDGPEAVAGQSMTLFLRAGVAPAVMALGLLPCLAIFGIGQGPSAESFFVPFTLIFGVPMAVMAAMLPAAVGVTLQAADARRLPLAGAAIRDGWERPVLWVLGLVGLEVLVLVALVTFDPLVSLLCAAFVVSFAYLLSVAPGLVSSRIPPPALPGASTDAGATLRATGWILLLTIGEIALLLAVPIPHGWNPFYLPLGTATLVNLAAIRPVRWAVAREVGQPYRG